MRSPNMSYSSLPLTSKLFQLTTLTLSLALAGCGGGDGTDTIAPKPDLGASLVVVDSSDTDEAENTSTLKVNEIYLFSNYSSLNVNMPKDTSIKIEALILDDNNGVIDSKMVTFKITDPKLTGLFSASSSQLTTNEQGRAVIELTSLETLTTAQRDYLIANGLTVEASVDGVVKSLTLYGTQSNVSTQKDDIYDVFISSNKTTLLTGKDEMTVSIRVTDKKGGIIAGVPVIIGITDAALYGLSLGASSSQVTDANGLIEVKLVQSRVSTDAQLDHESLLTVVVDDEVNSIVEQTFPIMVSGTRISNIVSSKNTISPGEAFTISGQILDGATTSISSTQVVLYNNNVVAGTATTDISGKFTFYLNSANLTAINDTYVFDMQINGAKTNQRFNDALQVGSTVTSSMNFANINDLEINKRKPVTLNVPDANDGDIVTLITNKGKISKDDTEDAALASNRRKFTVTNKQLVFYIESGVPDTATIIATHTPIGQSENTKQTVVNFVSIEPTKLLLQTESSVLSTGGASTVTARVLDEHDNPVKNAIVQFTTTKDASGGSLAAGVAYTGSDGVATVTYNAGQTPTATDGVVIEAEVNFIQLPDGTEDSVKKLIDDAKISVQTTSTFISFAFANTVSSSDNNVYYYQQGSISVLNSTGKPAINQPVSINLNPYRYAKGLFAVTLDSIFNEVWTQYVYLNGDTTNPPLPGPKWCPNEDTNNNGILDAGEDINGNGQLDPVNTVAVLDKDGTVVASNQDFNFVTDDTGKVDFSIRYFKEYADWYNAKITVNTSVDGSESQQSRIVGLSASVDDVDITVPIRPNGISPFGIASTCDNPD